MQERVHVQAIGVERNRVWRLLAVVGRHEDQVDVGLRPDGIVGQAAAEKGSQHAPILLYLGDELIERRGERLTC